MEGRTSLKLIMEKGPREGETLKYSSASLIKVGRVVRGNTVAIKDSGISTKHMSIQFDNQLCKWTLCDLDSSNGTVLNGQSLTPHIPSVLNDGDQIKIGELTSIVVKYEVESNVQLRRNPRRQGKSEPDAVVENGKVELGLGFGADLGENEVKEPVKKRNLRSSAKKAVDSRNEVVCLNFTLKQIPENLSVDGEAIAEGKMKRGRKKKKMAEKVVVETDLDKRKAANVVVPFVGRMTRGRRKGMSTESSGDEQCSGLEENLKCANKSLEGNEGNEATFDKISENEFENMDTNNESAQEQLENLVSTQECCDRNMADESSLKGKEYVNDGCGNVQGMALEKMTLGDFFDYLEVQLPKEIYEKSEKFISDLEEKARKCHEFTLQKNEAGKGKP